MSVFLNVKWNAALVFLTTPKFIEKYRKGDGLCTKIESSSVAPLTSIVFFSYMEVNGAPKQSGYKLSSKYLPLCSAEQRHSYRFGTT